MRSARPAAPRSLVALSLLACAGFAHAIGCGGAAASSSPSAEGPVAAAPIAPAPTPTSTAHDGAGVSASNQSDAPSAPVEPAPVEPAAPPPPPAPPPPCPEGMVLIPGGEYEQGPFKRKETIGDLCVDRTEVTAAAYAKCTAANQCGADHLDCADAATYAIEGKENHPIVCVDHVQATQYCEFAGKRLPTTGEWEWFARGGDAGQKYAWGDDDPGDKACWSGSSAGARTGTCEVGAYADGATPSGLVDMSGNVFEWTSSQADSTGKMMVGKGGSWRDGVKNLLAVARPMGFEPQYRCGFGGMRCVTEPKAPASATMSP